jgi:hypothetical protein
MSDSSGIFAVASNEGAVSVIPACAAVSAGLYDRNSCVLSLSLQFLPALFPSYYCQVFRLSEKVHLIPLMRVE